MNGLVKAVRHIQIKKIAFKPELYIALITYEIHPHPTEYDESDDIEYQKNLINKLINDNWFVKGGINIPDHPDTYF